MIPVMNAVAVIRPVPHSPLLASVEKRSGEKVSRCYQCGKCTAGCPVSYVMDLGPRRIMRAVQLGLREEVFSSNSIWMCVFCQTCSARCPLDIDIARVMESLRLMASAEKSAPAERDIELFHRLFLKVVYRWGRIHELGMAGLYNLAGRHPLANIDLLPAMFSKGKISILPPRVKGASQLRDIFARVRQVEAEAEANERGDYGFPEQTGGH